MRLLKRNLKIVYYKTYTGKAEVVINGVKTGEYAETYSVLKSLKMNVGMNGSTVKDEPFGIDEPYSRILKTNNLSCDMDVTSLVWIDKSPTQTVGEVTTETKPNFRVIAKRQSLNTIEFLVRERE